MLAALLAAAVLADAPPEDPAATLAELKRIYEQSCVTRAYGSYDDVCDGMARQIQVYSRQVARARRERPPSSAAPVSADPASAGQQDVRPSTAAATSVEPLAR